MAAAGDQGSRNKLAAQAAARVKPRRRRHQAAVPNRGQIVQGWSDMLGEITSSSRRIRVAKGGHFGAKALANGHAPPLVEEAAQPSANPPDAEEDAVSPREVTASGEEGADAVVHASDGEAAAYGSERLSESGVDFEKHESSPSKQATGSERVSPVGTTDIDFERQESSSSRKASQSARLPTPPDGGTPRSPAAAEAEVLNWRSYGIDDKKVPDGVLASLWKRAVDPKHCMEEVEALARVPRMTVTRREVEQLPSVHDMQHWRAVKTKRMEARKAFEESETFPPLAEMMRTIFGTEEPPRKRIHGLYAQMKEIYNAEKRRSSAAGYVTSRSALSEEATNEEEFEIEAKATLQAAADIEQEEEDAMNASNKKAYMGCRRKGRRDAFDEGQPWQRGNQPLAEIEEKMEERRLKNSRVTRVLQASQEAEFDDEHVKKLGLAHQKVNDRCQRKVMRMHTQFARKQGQLSARLTRRVQRLQMDFEETQDTKVSSILPSVVAKDGIKPRSSSGSAAGTGTSEAVLQYLQRSFPVSLAQILPSVVAKDGIKPKRSNGSAGGPGTSETVLQYLQHHRHMAEQNRQSHHAIYLQQVERFQGYLKLLADPNRSPERGELYLSECFRHVLAAGLIVDNGFFIRVLFKLEAEDFEKTATVNLVAACCVSFNIDLRQYWTHLNQRGVSFLTPRPQTNEARSWEDWAPWNGVKLEKLVPALSDAELCEELQDGAETFEDVARLAEDAALFAPIVPEDTSSDMALLSRNEGDPLAAILKKVALDSVLERYQIRRAEGHLSPHETTRRGEGDDAFGDEHAARAEGTPSGSISSTHVAGQSRSLQTPPKDKSGKPSTPPLPPGGARTGPGRPGAKGKFGTLARTRGVAEPMADMANAPDKDRPRAGAQAPQLSAITERPLLE